MKLLSMSEYKQTVLNILIKLDEICRENNLKYFLMFGTLLGAVRHKGFIPWDDDVDICMFREDYDKLAQIIQNGNYGLNFLRIEECPDTIFPYGKICDENTYMIEKNFKPVKGYGAFIDVFPLDYLPEDPAEYNKIKKHFYMYRRVIEQSSRIGYEKADSFVANLKRAGAFWCTRLVNTRKTLLRMRRSLVELNNTKTNMIGCAWYRAYPLEEFETVSYVEFEKHTFMAPRDPDAILKIDYGDYMQLPPEEDRIPNHQLTCYIKES